MSANAEDLDFLKQSLTNVQQAMAQERSRVEAGEEIK